MATKEHLDWKSGQNCGQRVQSTTGKEGGGSRRHRWMKTGGLWHTLHGEQRRTSRVTYI